MFDTILQIIDSSGDLNMHPATYVSMLVTILGSRNYRGTLPKVASASKMFIFLQS